MESCKDVARELARIYCTLSPAALNELAEILIPFKFAKGDKVLKEGEVCHYMYYVNKGIVRQYYYKNNKDVTEHFSYEGRMVICIESFLKQEPTRLMVEALENSALYAIPHDELEALTERNLEIQMFYRKVLEHALISSQQHADRQRFETAQTRYAYLMSMQPQIFLRAPLVHIASYLQMAPETLSRVRAAKAAEQEKEMKERREAAAKALAATTANSSSSTPDATPKKVEPKTDEPQDIEHTTSEKKGTASKESNEQKPPAATKSVKVKKSTSKKK